MSETPAALTTRLQAAAATAIEKALAKRKLPAEATLADIEQCAREAGQEIEQAIAVALAEESAAHPIPTPDCPTCKKK
jgi:hypothetical protein